MPKMSAEKKKKSIDDTDHKIIKFLQKDGRMSNTVIAKKLGVSEATVRTRLNRLIDEEYIQIVAVSNPLKLGFEAVGILKIHVDIKKIDRITEELHKLKPIWFVVRTTGDADIYTEFVAKSIGELNELIFQKIYTIDGVIRTETSLILQYNKRQYDWGVAE